MFELCVLVQLHKSIIPSLCVLPPQSSAAKPMALRSGRNAKPKLSNSPGFFADFAGSRADALFVLGILEEVVTNVESGRCVGRSYFFIYSEVLEGCVLGSFQPLVLSFPQGERYFTGKGGSTQESTPNCLGASAFLHSQFLCLRLVCC